MTGDPNLYNMSEVILTIYNVVVKGYHECLLSVELGECFVAQKKRGDAKRFCGKSNNQPTSVMPFGGTIHHGLQRNFRNVQSDGFLTMMTKKGKNYYIYCSY